MFSGLCLEFATEPWTSRFVFATESTAYDVPAEILSDSRQMRVSRLQGGV